LKTHLKPNNTFKTMQDVVAESKAIESAQKTNKIIGEAKKGLETRGLEEQVNWTMQSQSHEIKTGPWDMPLVWEPERTTPMEILPSEWKNLCKMWGE
jgi:hypothetical protein